jgi:hypothetical protein
VTRHPALAWILVAVWGAWLFAARGALAGALGGATGAGAWVPDLGLVLLIALAIEMPRREVTLAALALAVARTAVSIDPPLAIFAAFGAVAVVARALRRGLDLRGTVQRFVLAGVAALAVHVWLALVHDVRSSIELARAAEVVPHARGFAAAVALASPTALATAIASALAGPAFARLPGPSSLIGRSRWRAAVSSP